MASACKPLSTLPASIQRESSEVKKPVSQGRYKKIAPRRIIGTPVQRLEGPEKVSGRAIYATDVCLPDMLWCKVLRSPISYGRIKKIDVSRARALPGVRAIVTGEDVKGLLIGRKIYDMPILADGVVRFIGEKVAAVAAESEAVAEEAVELIDVEYEEMAALLDPLEAIQPAATLLHPNVRVLSRPAPSDRHAEQCLRRHDIGKRAMSTRGFATRTSSSRTLSRPSRCIKPISNRTPASCRRKTLAAPISGLVPRYRSRCANKSPTAFGKGLENFVVHPCYIGGCFGGKGDFMDVPVCYLLSLKSGRPVKRVMDYSEEFVAGNPRHAAIVQVKTGVKKDGRLVAHRNEVRFR